MSPRVFGAALAILAIAWGVLGLLKLWTDRRRHRTEMDLMDAYAAELQKLAAESRERKKQSE